MPVSEKIVIVTQSHLSKNPRVLKEALALNEAGYSVHILASIFSKTLFEQDMKLIKDSSIVFEPVSDLSKKGFRSFTDRLVTKFTRILIKTIGFETHTSLGYRLNRYLKRCYELKADLYICHQELPTVIGTKLIEKGYCVGFDLEDWYSEDLLPQSNVFRAINLLKKAEYIALNEARFCFCTSRVMAERLKLAYKSPPPIPLYNTFDPVQPQLKGTDVQVIKLVWFSQTIGMGRGLREFIMGMNQCPKAYHLTLIGNCSEDYSRELRDLIAPHHTITFQESLSPNALMEHLAGFDIGLAIELNVPLNRDLTISNKLFQYIGSGIPVIASRTKGQNEIMNHYDCGWQIELSDPENIAELLSGLTLPMITGKQVQTIDTAKKLSWTNEKTVLLQTVEQALH